MHRSIHNGEFIIIPKNNSDINFVIDLKIVSIIRSSSVYVEYKAPLITMEFNWWFHLWFYW